jgi:hypothetical protein
VANVPAHDLDYALAGMTYPATCWQVMTWADYNCAPGQTRTALQDLPSKTYPSLAAVITALQARLER